MAKPILYIENWMRRLMGNSGHYLLHMNDYLLKHTILNTFNNALNALKKKRDFALSSSVLYELMTKKHKKRFHKCLNYLVTDGFLELRETTVEGVGNVYITEKGVAAASGDYFLSKFWKRFSDIIRDVFSIIVAITAIITLIWTIINDGEKEAIRAETTSLRQELYKQQKLLDSIRLSHPAYPKSVQNYYWGDRSKQKN